MSAEVFDQVERLERLGGIAKRIRQHHDQALAAAHVFRKACEALAEENLLCGQALLEAKGLVPHGEWLDWLERNCARMDKRTAQRYMELARRNQANATRLSLSGRVRRFTYRLFAGWAQRTPPADQVLGWPVEDQRRALADLEPTERLCVALRANLAGVSDCLAGVSDCLTGVSDCLTPPTKESI